MARHKMSKIVLVCICLSLLASGCAENQSAGKIIGTTAGAGLGALVGNAFGGGKGAIFGAVIGAAVGFGVGWLADNYKAKQLKSAEAARQEAVAANRPLPEQPTLNNYSIAVVPADTVKRGKSASIVSTIDLSPGSKGKAEIKEVAVLKLPDGTEKTATVPYPEISEGGTFEFERNLNTKGIPGGVYGYKTTLYINGTAVASKDSSFKVVSNGSIMYAQAR
jgi:hypothetical protein